MENASTKNNELNGGKAQVLILALAMLKFSFGTWMAWISKERTCFRFCWGYTSPNARK